MDEHTLLKQLAPHLEEPYRLERWGLFSKKGNVGDFGSVCYLMGDCFKRADEVGHGGSPLVFTTRIVGWDPASKVATTKTGSRYMLYGPPHSFITDIANKREMTYSEMLARAAAAGAASL